jgi:hypothetical protein
LLFIKIQKFTKLNLLYAESVTFAQYRSKKNIAQGLFERPSGAAGGHLLFLAAPESKKG